MNDILCAEWLTMRVTVIIIIISPVSNSPNTSIKTQYMRLIPILR